MTKNEIKNILNNSKFIKHKNNKFNDLNSSILVVYNNCVAYAFWAIKYNSGELIYVGYTLDEKTNSVNIDEFDDNNNFVSMWKDDLIKKYNSLENAMNNF